MTPAIRTILPKLNDKGVEATVISYVAQVRYAAEQTSIPETVSVQFHKIG